MITAQNVLETLEKNLEEIRIELGPDWSLFNQEIASHRGGFADITDRNALEIAADPVWQVCRRYPFVKELVHKHTAQRKLPAGGTDRGDQISVREIANRFQSLFDKLEEMERSGETQDRWRQDMSQPRAENANDR